MENKENEAVACSGARFDIDWPNITGTINFSGMPGFKEAVRKALQEILAEQAN